MSLPDNVTDRVYPNPGSFMDNEKYVVCKRNGNQEVVCQSDRDPDRAQHSVDIGNEHEERNAREPNYYWRTRIPGEPRKRK